MNTFFVDPWTPGVASLLLKSSIVIGVMAAVYAVLRPRSSAATRHLVCALTFVSLLVLPLLTMFGPSWKIAVPPFDEAARVVHIERAAQVLSDAVAGDRRSATVPTPATAPAAPLTSGRPASAEPGWAWRDLAAAIYVAGVVLLLLRMVLERLAVARLVHRAEAVTDLGWRRLLRDAAARIGVEGPVRLLRSREQTMPMAFGIRSRSVLLPAIADTWSEDRRRAVLLHELAHVARHDCLSQAVAAITCAIYWVHPGAWWMARRLRIERELACDDRVIEAGTTAPNYAGHLLELAYSLGGHRAPALVVTMARPNQLEGRMLAILDDRRNRTIPGRQHRMAATAIAAAIIVPLASAEGTAVPGHATYVVEAPAYAGAPAGDRVMASDRRSAAEARPEASPDASQAVTSSSAETGDDTEDGGPGTWEVRPSMKPGYLHLLLRELHSSSGSDVALKQLEGLSAQQLESGSGPVRF